MSQVANIVVELTSGTGTGNLTLTSIAGYRQFSAAFGTGASNTFYYCIRNTATSSPEYEVGIGHITGANALVRSTVIESSNANALVNFSAGQKEVICDLHAAYQMLIRFVAGNSDIPLSGAALARIGNTAGNYWQFASDGTMSPAGTNFAPFKIGLDVFAFNVVSSLAGIFFRFLGTILPGPTGYAATDLFGGDIATIDVAGTDSVVNAVYGFAHGVTTPAAISANQNDYAGFTGGGIVRLSSTGAFNITGAAAPPNGRAQMKHVYNVGANNITLPHQDAASLAANRFLNVTGANIVLAPNERAILDYDPITQRWRCGKA